MTTNGASNPTEVMARIRERVRARQAGAGGHYAPPLNPVPMLNAASFARYQLTELHANLADCNALHNAVGTLNPRRPGLHNQVLQLVKKLMRRSLTWYTRPLHAFQAAATRTLNHTTIALEEARVGLGVLEVRVANLEQRLQQTATMLQQTATTAEESVRALHRDLRRTRDEFRQAGASPERSEGEPPAGQAVSASTGAPAPELDFDYFMFEEHFRGPESEIKRRQQSYVEYFRGCSDVLDLGCGRGEFLEALRENGISARGVETGKDAFLVCQEKGLAVTQQNLFSCLESLPDESAGGIFCSQVIEHMEPAAQLRLAKLAHQKLRPGSPLVVETINPGCVYALCRNFYLDPTHVRPVHPEMLAFALRSLGFHTVETKYFWPLPDLQLPKLSIGEPNPELDAFNRAVVNVNELLFGPQDYAAIGWR